MSKNDKRILIVDAIVLVIFTVLAFAIPFPKNATFFVAYIMGIVAIGVQLYVWKVAFRTGESVKSKFYGFPIAKIGLIYLAAQLVFSFIFMAVAVICPAWIAIVVAVILLGLAAIGFISADATRDEIERQDVKLITDTSCMQELRSVVYPLAGLIEDAESKTLLTNLADEFRYSDPVSSETIKDVENDLKQLVYELQKAVMDGDTSSINGLAKKTLVQLTERNRVCKLNKGK